MIRTFPCPADVREADEDGAYTPDCAAPALAGEAGWRCADGPHDTADTSAGDAFFAGSGGDGSAYSSLDKAGWSTAWWEAGYYWAMRAPDGRSGITYVEGDIYDGVQKPLRG